MTKNDSGSMGQVYLIFNDVPFLWDTSDGIHYKINILTFCLFVLLPNLEIMAWLIRFRFIGTGNRLQKS